MDNWQDWNVIKLKKPATKRTQAGEVVSRDRQIPWRHLINWARFPALALFRIIQ